MHYRLNAGRDNKTSLFVFIQNLMHASVDCTFCNCDVYDVPPRQVNLTHHLGALNRLVLYQPDSVCYKLFDWLRSPDETSETHLTVCSHMIDSDQSHAHQLLSMALYSYTSQVPSRQHRSVSALLQEMAWRPAGANPFLESRLSYHRSHHQEQLSVKYFSKFERFYC